MVFKPTSPNSQLSEASTTKKLEFDQQPHSSHITMQQSPETVSTGTLKNKKNDELQSASPTTSAIGIPECPPSPGGRSTNSNSIAPGKKSMSMKLKNLRRKMSGRRSGVGMSSVTEGGSSVASGGVGALEGVEDRLSMSGRIIGGVPTGSYPHASPAASPMMEMEVPSPMNGHHHSNNMMNQGNPQGASDVEKEYYDERETIDGGRGGSSQYSNAHQPGSHSLSGTPPAYHQRREAASSPRSHVVQNSDMAVGPSATEKRPSTPPPPTSQATAPFQFISDDNFTRRVDSYDGQVIVCSDSKVPTYEVGNYLGGGVAGVVYEGKRLRPVNEYPPVRVRGGGAFYPTPLSADGATTKMHNVGGGSGPGGPSPAAPIAMTMTSSSLSSTRRRVPSELTSGASTGLFAEVHRAVVPEAYHGEKSLAHQNNMGVTSPSNQTEYQRVADDAGGCTSFIFNNCNCGNDLNVDDRQSPMSPSHMPFPNSAISVDGLNGDDPNAMSQAARQKYLAVDLASIEVPAAFSSVEQETPTNASVHHVVVDDADAPNRSKREARALSRNTPASRITAPQSTMGSGNGLQVGGSTDLAVKDASSFVYGEDQDLLKPYLIEDISETVAIKILNPVGFRLLDPETLYKAVIVREGTLPTVEPDGTFRLTEEHVWWLVNPNSRNLRSLLRRNNHSHSQASRDGSSHVGGDEEASEETNLQKNKSNFSQSLGGGIDRGTAERGLRLSLVATYVDPKTSTLRELPLPRCVEIWGHPPFAATDQEFEAMMDVLLRLNAGVGSGIRRRRSSARRSPSFSNGVRGGDYYDPLASIRGGSTVYCPALSAYIAIPAVPPKYLRWLKQRRLATKEVRNMMKIGRHQNVVHLYEVLELVQDSKSTMFLILELVRGGELFDLISSNSGSSSSKRKNESRGLNGDELHEFTMRKFFRELASGISFIHQCGVAHRDLKPENLLIHTKPVPATRKQGVAPFVSNDEDQRTLKIADFGLSAAFDLNPSMDFWHGIPRGDSSASRWDGGSTLWDVTHGSRTNSPNSSRYSGLPLSPNSDRSSLSGKSGLSPLLNRVGATALSYLTCGSMTNVCDGASSDFVDDGYGGSRVPLRRMTSVVGSPHYVAPEIISQATIDKGDGDNAQSKADNASGGKKSGKSSTRGGYDGTKADVWSAGVILYAMLFRSLPFGEDLLRCPRYQAFQKWYNDARQLQPALKAKKNRRAYPEYTLDPTYDEWDEEEMLGPHWFFPHEISVEGRDLIVAMLNPNPYDRITIDMVLHHPWLQSLDDLRRVSSVPQIGGLCLSGT